MSERVISEVPSEVTSPPEDAPVSQEPTPIPEKFQNEDGSLNQEAVLKSYGELEAQNSTPPTGGEPAPEPQAAAPVIPEGLQVPEQAFVLDEGMEKWAVEWKDNGGKLSDETYATIEKETGASPEFVGRHMAGEDAIAALAVYKIHDQVGGHAEYDKMVQWEAKTSGDAAAQAFVTQLGGYIGDHTKAAEMKQAVEGLFARYNQAMGKSWAPEVTGIDSGGEQITPFASEYEFAQALKSDEYKGGDVAFHRMVDLRLAKAKAQGIW